MLCGDIGVQPARGGLKIYLLCVSMCRRCLCVCARARMCVHVCASVCMCVVSVCCAHQQRHVKAEKAIDNSLKQGAMPPHDHSECEIRFIHNLIQSQSKLTLKYQNMS